MLNTELQNPGLKFDNNPNDFVIGSGTILDIPQNYNRMKFFYNQAAQSRTRNGCGIYASLGTISDLTGYEFIEEQLFACIDKAEESYGWQEDGGMYMSKAVDCTRDFWNEIFPERRLMTIKTSIGADIYKEALSKGHSLSVGYRTSIGYYYDSQDDGMINQETYSNIYGGHLVRCTKDNHIIIRDNYIGHKKYNSYVNNKIEIHKKNGIFFPSAYLFLYEDKELVKQLREERIKEIIGIISEIYEKENFEGDSSKVRISIWQTLKNIGYSKKNIQYAMRKFYGMNITPEM